MYMREKRRCEKRRGAGVKGGGVSSEIGNCSVVEREKLVVISRDLHTLTPSSHSDELDIHPDLISLHQSSH